MIWKVISPALVDPRLAFVETQYLSTSLALTPDIEPRSQDSREPLFEHTKRLGIAVDMDGLLDRVFSVSEAWSGEHPEVVKSEDSCSDKWENWLGRRTRKGFGKRRTVGVVVA